MRDLAVEYAVLVAPSIVAISFPEWNVALVLGLSMLGFIVLFSLPNTGKLSTNEHPFANLKALPPVLAYRSTMMLLTCASILAVDFASFPRRFAKCEDFGTSLMDMGVGSFVFSNGLVSGRPKPEKDTQNKDKKPSRGGLLSVLRSSLPVFFLGVLRGISVRGANYQTHSSEYGLHWNFFVTLGMVAIGAGLGREVERVLGGGKRFPVGFWTVLGVLISLGAFCDVVFRFRTSRLTTNFSPFFDSTPTRPLESRPRHLGHRRSSQRLLERQQRRNLERSRLSRHLFRFLGRWPICSWDAERWRLVGCCSKDRDLVGWVVDPFCGIAVLV